jgi:hypothetical protein
MSALTHYDIAEKYFKLGYLAALRENDVEIEMFEDGFDADFHDQFGELFDDDGNLKPKIIIFDSIVHPIPEMVHPLSKHWFQPNRESIEVFSDRVEMDKKTFDALPTYNHTNPTALYPGKMWRRESNAAKPCWFLCWVENTTESEYPLITMKQISVKGVY